MISLEDYSLVRDFRAAHGPVWALALKMIRQCHMLEAWTIL